MGWNDPDKDKDNWKGKGEPPDLDEALKKFQEKLRKSFFGADGNQSPPPGDSGRNASGGGMLVVVVAIIAIVLWALSGIFIIDPAEQGVVMRFGKYVRTVEPGPHWIPRIFESKIVRDVKSVKDYSYKADMLTKDENLVSVSLVVQYRIGDQEAYLFNVSDPQESLQQATSSALRQVVGTTTLDQIITEGREVWGSAVEASLVEILGSYKTGIEVVNVSPQPARAPEDVQDAFDDAIKAQEDEKRFKEQARAYEASVVPKATGQAKRILEEAQAFAQQAVLRAKGDVAEFLALLPEYKAAPRVTSERMYLEAMQRVLQQSSKIIVDKKSGNLMYLPLEQMMKGQQSQKAASGASTGSELTPMVPSSSATSTDISNSRQVVRRIYRPGRDI